MWDFEKKFFNQFVPLLRLSALNKIDRTPKQVSGQVSVLASWGAEKPGLEMKERNTSAPAAKKHCAC